MLDKSLALPPLKNNKVYKSQINIIKILAIKTILY